jgi:hypothetical protein
MAGLTASASGTLDAATPAGLSSSFVRCPTTTPVVTIAAITAAAEPMTIALVRCLRGGVGTAGGGKVGGSGGVVG